MVYQLMTDLRMCSCESEGMGNDDSGNSNVGVKSIVTTVPVERVIAAGGEVCIALLASKSATKPAL